VYTVHSDSELASAIGAARAGSCIALVPGTYGDAILPVGVSLLGKGASFVGVNHIAMSGTGVVVRGMTVRNGVELDSTVSAHIDSVRIAGSQGDGITFKNGASASIVNADIEGATTYGISAFGTGSVQIDRTYIGHGLGPGLWVECQAGCACVTKPTLTVTNTALQDNKIVGISLVATIGTLTNVDVTNNTEANFKAGAGVSVSQCSSLEATNVNVLDNTGFGVLLDQSSGTLGTSGTNRGMRIERNLMGLWVQNLSSAGNQPVRIENCALDANVGVGLGVSGASNGVTIHGTVVTNTTSMVLPVLVNGVGAGSKDVGDGLNWLGLSGVSIDGLTLTNNARASFLIDGAVAPGSSIANVTLSGGDQQKGILEQNLPMGGRQPQVVSGAPAITVNMGEVYAVATSPAVPSGI
jgi:hypothetical protein